MFNGCLDDRLGFNDRSLDNNRRLENRHFLRGVLVGFDGLFDRCFLCDGFLRDRLLRRLFVSRFVVGLLCRSLFCRSLLGGGLLFGLGLFGLFVTNETVTLGATTYTVGLCLDDRRRVALHVDTHYETEIDGLFVCEAELFGELVDAHVLWQVDFSLSIPIR